MTEKEKEILIDRVLDDFDFMKIACLTNLMDPSCQFMKELARMRKSALRLLRMALDHEDEDFWWAGGIGHGGFCAWWDKKRGLSLNFILTANQKKPKSEDNEKTPTTPTE